MDDKRYIELQIGACEAAIKAFHKERSNLQDSHRNGDISTKQININMSSYIAILNIEQAKLSYWQVQLEELS